MKKRESDDNINRIWNKKEKRLITFNDSDDDIDPLVFPKNYEIPDFDELFKDDSVPFESISNVNWKNNDEPKNNKDKISNNISTKNSNHFSPTSTRNSEIKRLFSCCSTIPNAQNSPSNSSSYCSKSKKSYIYR